MLKPGLVRFLLSSIVIFYHLSGYIYIGTMAVYCFFILSGYWISYMYDKKYVNYKETIRTFYLSRLFRLFPVYLLLGILTVIMSIIYMPNFFTAVKLSDNKGLFWFSNLFIIGYNQLAFRPVVPAWSLDIELQFYILLPVLFVISKTPSKRFITLLLFCVVSIIVFVAFPSTVVSKTVIPYLLYFFIGIFIYQKQIKFSRQTEIVFNCIFVLILIVHYTLGATPFYQSFKAIKYYESHFNQIISLLLVPLLSNCVYRKSDKRDRILGEMSYVLYLTHWLFIIPYNHYIIGYTKIQRIPSILVYLIITYAMSYIIFKYFDKPIDSIRRKWLEKQSLKEVNIYVK